MSQPQRNWKTVAEERGSVESFPSFRAAKRALGSRLGHELHHLVEQSQALVQRSGFAKERINTTDNLVWVPVEVHRRISAEYSSKPDGSDMTLRDALNGTSWERQYNRGMREVNQAWKEQGEQ